MKTIPYKNHPIEIPEELFETYSSTISPIKEHTLEYLLKTNDGNDGMSTEEMQRIILRGMRGELHFHAQVPDLIEAARRRGDLV